jgi:hypothetical protein
VPIPIEAAERVVCIGEVLLSPGQERLCVPSLEYRLDFCAKTSRQTAKSRLDRIPSPVDDFA